MKTGKWLSKAIVKKRIHKDKKKKNSTLVKNGDIKNDAIALPPVIGIKDEPVHYKPKWTNKQRVLVLCSRGVSFRVRHLASDLIRMMPHARTESKFNKTSNLLELNEVCEMKKCKSCLYFEMRKRRDVYLWISSVPNGPSAKFFLENIHTTSELKLIGNALKYSRPILTFDSSFQDEVYLSVLKEMLSLVFNTPKNHPKSQPFIDRIINFSVVNNKIWFRNYQVLADNDKVVEIGPRFVMDPIKIFYASFGGAVLWQNPNYQSPSFKLRLLKQYALNKYRRKEEVKRHNQDKAGSASFQHEHLENKV